MFGAYRTLLAVMVILLQLGGMPVIGSYAVFGFNILSGYLMMLIMQRNYGYTKSGITKYALNRFLRMYPIYWAACILTLLVIVSFGDKLVADYHKSMIVPVGIKAVAENFLLIFPTLGGPRLTPPAWALTVEIFFYICIGLGLSKSKVITMV